MNIFEKLIIWLVVFPIFLPLYMIVLAPYILYIDMREVIEEIKFWDKIEAVGKK